MSEQGIGIAHMPYVCQVHKGKVQQQIQNAEGIYYEQILSAVFYPDNGSGHKYSKVEGHDIS